MYGEGVLAEPPIQKPSMVEVKVICLLKACFIQHVPLQRSQTVRLCNGFHSLFWEIHGGGHVLCPSKHLQEI